MAFMLRRSLLVLDRPVQWTITMRCRADDIRIRTGVEQLCDLLRDPSIRRVHDRLPLGDLVRLAMLGKRFDRPLFLCWRTLLDRRQAGKTVGGMLLHDSKHSFRALGA